MVQRQGQMGTGRTLMTVLVIAAAVIFGVPFLTSLIEGSRRPVSGAVIKLGKAEVEITEVRKSTISPGLKNPGNCVVIGLKVRKMPEEGRFRTSLILLYDRAAGVFYGPARAYGNEPKLGNFEAPEAILTRAGSSIGVFFWVDYHPPLSLRNVRLYTVKEANEEFPVEYSVWSSDWAARKQRMKEASEKYRAKSLEMRSRGTRRLRRGR